jgi:hypothetical protein
MHLELFSSQPEGNPQSAHATPLLFIHGPGMEPGAGKKTFALFCRAWLSFTCL